MTSCFVISQTIIVEVHFKLPNHSHFYIHATECYKGMWHAGIFLFEVKDELYTGVQEVLEECNIPNMKVVNTNIYTVKTQIIVLGLIALIISCMPQYNGHMRYTTILTREFFFLYSVSFRTNKDILFLGYEYFYFTVRIEIFFVCMIYGANYFHIFHFHFFAKVKFKEQEKTQLFCLFLEFTSQDMEHIGSLHKKRGQMIKWLNSPYVKEYSFYRFWCLSKMVNKIHNINQDDMTNLYQKYDDGHKGEQVINKQNARAHTARLCDLHMRFIMLIVNNLVVFRLALKSLYLVQVYLDYSHSVAKRKMKHFLIAINMKCLERTIHNVLLNLGAVVIYGAHQILKSGRILPNGLVSRGQHRKSEYLNLFSTFPLLEITLNVYFKYEDTHVKLENISSNLYAIIYSYIYDSGWLKIIVNTVAVRYMSGGIACLLDSFPYIMYKSTVHTVAAVIYKDKTLFRISLGNNTVRGLFTFSEVDKTKLFKITVYDITMCF
ncbi:hypothetical protein ACJX0J_032828 [Zea mays]